MSGIPKAIDYISYFDQLVDQDLTPMDYESWLESRFHEYQQECAQDGVHPMDFRAWVSRVEIDVRDQADKSSDTLGSGD